VKILPATWRDFNAIRHLEKVCFPQDAWSIFDILSALTLPGIVRLKVEVDGCLAGFVVGELRPDQNAAWIASLGVLPEYRCRGIASALLRACEDAMHYTRLRLSLRRENEAAMRLYSKHGYYQVGVWRGYYHDKEDAIVMEKTYTHED
jgi:ribosomal-protein-alanine N-acetyltransferase